MGRRAYPTVEVRVEEITYGTAEIILNNLAENDDFNQKNKESKYEKSEHNGKTDVKGYIKLSLTHQELDVDVFANYTTGDERVKVEYESDRTEDVPEFRDALEVFENGIHPTISRVIDEDNVRMKVTTRHI